MFLFETASAEFINKLLERRKGEREREGAEERTKLTSSSFPFTSRSFLLGCVKL